ncbi:uncharacterized protein LOC110990208 [Acanthaster planci]|uniref:Uncharacterized protein LOC110990208 n=1 Tax=Acanthaster planci TaxID=133434 RepID=A0A8B7ZZC0_ACAPL|nr:uncharacterized protein LOC110990208 [Acanthaster planci]
MARGRVLVSAFLGYLIILVIVLAALNQRFSISGVQYIRAPSTKRQMAFPNRSVSMSTAETNVVKEPDLNVTKSHTITLTIRMTSTVKFKKRFFCDLLRSAVLFWSPKLGPISLILDKGSKGDRKFAARLVQQEHELGFKFNVIYEPLPQDHKTVLKSRLGLGYGRQLWSSFMMDLFIDASIIAWIDTDGVFTTPVTPENIVNGQRLRVVSITQDWKRLHDLNWFQTTERAIGKQMVADFMTYFPVYIWRDTIINCRNHISRHMNVTRFEDAFRNLYNLSPVNVIMNYAFYFEHDRYDWHLDVNNDLKSYNKDHVPPGFEIKPSQTVPDVQVSIHKGYYDKLPNPLLQGYCVAKRYVSTLPAFCKPFENVTNFQLFEFCWQEKLLIQEHLGTWCASPEGHRDCAQRIEAHYANVVKYYNLGWFDLDLGRVGAVEKKAAQEKSKCPKVF